ncbi:MAG TPA: glycosyltransferase [Solirubrobacteraceae bacterium]|nr:glycosyltransferase [Solirubrobacteraceae bacterium]
MTIVSRPATQPRVALVHDFLLDVRGAERVFLQLCAMWPTADIFTAVYDADGTEGRFADRTVHSSFLQRVRPTARTFRALLPLYPSAIESFDLSGYDLVVSSSSAWAHAVRCPPGTVHVSYCHNPFRYAWNDRDSTLASRNPLTRSFLRTAFRRWRQWDFAAAQRTTRYVANSMITQARIRAYFAREAEIVHPPVDTWRFSPGPVGDYYAVVSELMAHKQIDVAIDAFNALRRPLVIVGDGPAIRALRRKAGPTIRFTGRVSDAEVARTLQGARALVLTAVEEFGIAAVESQAAGRPVIARAGGGALETVVNGVTGCFWSGGPDELAAAVVGFDDAAIDPEACVLHAARFDSRAFADGMRQEVAIALDAGSDALGSEEPALAASRLIRRGATETL